MRSLASAVGVQRLADEGSWGFGGAGTATLTSSTLELKVLGLRLVWPPPDLGPPHIYWGVRRVKAYQGLLGLVSLGPMVVL